MLCLLFSLKEGSNLSWKRVFGLALKMGLGPSFPINYYNLELKFWLKYAHVCVILGCQFLEFIIFILRRIFQFEGLLQSEFQFILRLPKVPEVFILTPVR